MASWPVGTGGLALAGWDGAACPCDLPRRRWLGFHGREFHDVELNVHFLSDRSTDPVLDSRDLNVIEVRNAVPFMVLLRKDVKNPFAALKGLPEEEEKKKDEKATAEGKKAEEKKPEGKDTKKDEKGEKPPEPVEIDLEGLSERFVQLPGVERGR